jgi:hypothetical protein
VRRDDPVRPIKVILKNIISSSQKFSTDLASQGLELITFEMTDECGNSNGVTKKIDAQVSRAQRYSYIGPSQMKEFEIVLTEGEWNNAYKLAKQGATKVRARVSYKNSSSIIYSDYDTIQFEG